MDEQTLAVNRCPVGSLRYIWRTGDTLTRVAAAFGTTISAMIDTNPNIDFMTVKSGTAVCIPSRILTCPDSDLYAVKAGDTLSQIAARYGITAGALMELNPYVEPTQLTIGQYICVPKAENDNEGDGNTDEFCKIGSEVPDCAEIRASQNACTGTDTIKCGQGLYDILIKYGMSYTEFAALNPRLALNALLPGQRYYYPLKACACSQRGRYIVQPGDTIASIASSFGITPSELLRRNPNRTPMEFTSGEEICISHTSD
ncbi:MAG: LysM peptidoglycan-binding domain-containing protein [Clostridia bacterium]|nr:LysM peptidoglycan-binding domain-containing protein [Clostridia bacterium]MBQ4157544.1 LysM peptidoglycan-binding domain-containing protein [Clostridia bacterium]